MANQSFPKLEYNEHCDCCRRNKITVEVFAPSAQETTKKPLFPPDEPWPSSMGDQCQQYWGRVERRCQLTQGHEPPCYFCVPAWAIKTDITLDASPEKASAELSPICQFCGNELREPGTTLCPVKGTHAK